MTIAHHFATELGRFRALTEGEIAMLDHQRDRARPSRRVWSMAEDRQLTRLRRQRLTAEQIGVSMGRSAMAVRSRIRKLRRYAEPGA